MKMRTRLILVIAIAVVLSATSNSFAAIYKYIDKYGIVSFADDLQAIPEQSRATATLVSGEREQERNNAAQKQSVAQGEAKPEKAVSSIGRGKVMIESYWTKIFSGRVLISVVVVVSALFAFVILGILDADHKKSHKIARVVILWGMTVYLIIAHRGDVVDLFRTVKGEVAAVQRDSEEKGKKAAKTMKEINAVIQQADHAASQASEGSDPDKKN